MRALAAVALLAHPVWAASPLHSAQQEKVLLARLEATENDGSLVEICKDGLTSWEGDVCCPSSCNQCGGDGCLKDEGGSNDCCIDEIHASNEVCSSASDVRCVMPKTCAEDKCLIECPYNRGCEAVWKRRGWNAPQKHDFDEGMISAPEAAPAVARERLQVSRPPDESIVELCEAGLTNWAGDVCCSSSCDQCGGNGASNDCSIDQIHVSSKVCSSASDVSCIMPKTCAEDKCLLECPYNRRCESVWQRRGWKTMKEVDWKKDNGRVEDPWAAWKKENGRVEVKPPAASRTTASPTSSKDGAQSEGEYAFGADGWESTGEKSQAAARKRLEAKTPAASPLTKAEAEAKDLAEADAKAWAEYDAKNEADAEAKAEAEVDAKVVAKADAKAAAEAEAEAEAKAEAKEKAVAEEKAAAREKAVAEAEADVKAKTEAEAEIKAEIKAKAEAKAKDEAELQAKLEADAKAKREAEAEAEAEAVAKTKVEEEEMSKAEAASKDFEVVWERRGTMPQRDWHGNEPEGMETEEGSTAGGKRLDAKNPAASSSSSSSSSSEPGEGHDLFGEEGPARMEEKVPPSSRQETERLEAIRDAARKEFRRNDGFEGFDEPKSTEGEGPQAGQWTESTEESPYDGGGIYTAFDDGQYHPDQAQPLPVVREDKKHDAQSDDLIASTAHQQASDVPINIVGEDGSETPVDQSGRQSGGQAAAEAAEDAPVQPEWMTEAAEEPPEAEAVPATVAAAPEPDAAYGGPITAADATLPDFPMDTLPDEATPTKELAVKPQPQQQQATAPGVDGVGPTSTAGGQIIAKAGELANAAANAAAIAKNMEAANAAAAQIAAANKAANTEANKAAYAAPTDSRDEGPAFKGGGGVRVTPSLTHPDESLVEYCRDGLMNADGTVCCSSQCEMCGESTIENGDGDCSVDQIEGSNEVCKSASDVKCIMPDDCSEDKCLLECAYNTGCEVVWRRRGWTSHPKAIALRSTQENPPAAASRRDAARGAGVRRLNPRRNLVKVF